MCRYCNEKNGRKNDSFGKKFKLDYIRVETFDQGA